MRFSRTQLPDFMQRFSPARSYQVPYFEAFRSSEMPLADNTRSLIPNAEALHINTDFVRYVREHAPARLLISLPKYGEPGREIELALERYNFAAGDANVVAYNGLAKDYSPQYRRGTYYRGFLTDDSTSLVSVSVMASQTVIVFSTPEGDFTISRGSVPNGSGLYSYVNDLDYLLENPTACGTVGEEYLIGEGHPPGSTDHGHQHRTTQCEEVLVYVECDFDMYARFGGSLQNVVDYTTAMFNVVSLLYERYDIRLGLSEILVYTSTDPYAGFTNTGNILNAFQANMAGGFNGDLAHFITTRPVGGGVAYRDVLCAADEFQTGVSGIYSGTDTLYRDVPTFTWSVEVVTHELGHNFGSPHTHACGFWSGGQAVDNCYNLESGPCGSVETPGPSSNEGTIMSYCHLCSDICGNAPAGISFAQGFGNQPGTLINTEYDNANCLSCSCRDNYEYNNTQATADSAAFDDLQDYDYQAGIQATLHNVQDQDYFELNVVNAGDLSLTLSGLPKDYDLQLLNASGTVINSSTNGGTVDESLTETGIFPGTYYVLVFSKLNASSSCSTYDLNLSWAPTAGCSSPGSDTTRTLCVNNGNVNLTTLLGGSPAGGGTWNDDDASGALTGATLDLNSIAQGEFNFTYTLAAGGGCNARSATLTTRIIDCSLCPATATCTSSPCAPYGSGNAHIARFRAGGLSNTTGDDLYTDYTGSGVILSASPCESTEIEVSQLPVSYGGDQVHIFVDWNNDGDFADPDEVQNVPFDNAMGSFNYIVNLVIPQNAVPGLRILRVRLANNIEPNYNQPCGNTIFGEVEDYLIRIEESLETTGVYPANQAICQGGEAIITLQEADNGIAYQVYEGATPLGTPVTGVEGEPIHFRIAGLPLGPHTLRVVGQAVNGCAGTNMDNTVSVEVVNSSGNGPATENAPGNALELNPSGPADRQFVLVDHHPLLDLSGSSFTVSAWVFPTNLTGTQIMLSKDATTDEIDYQLGLNGGQPFFSTHNGPSTVSSPASIPLNQWSHIAGVKNTATGEIALYVNGEQVGLTAYGGSPVTNSSQYLAIGRRVVHSSVIPPNSTAQQQFYRGLIDEVALFSEAKTTQEIREQMHLVKRGCADNVVAYFQLNETGDSVRSAYNGFVGRIEGNPNRVPSTLPVGYGTSNTQTIGPGAGTYTFTGADVEMNFSANSTFRTMVVSRLDTDINPNSTQPSTTYPAQINSVFPGKYWVIQNFGTGTFTTDVTFSNIAGVSPTDQATPSNLKLVRRSSRAYQAWTSITDATAYNGGSQAITFPSITSFSQAALGTETSSVLPVEWLGISAEPTAPDAVEVSWETAEELNNRGFWVEYRLEQDASFTQAAFLESAGDGSGKTKHYSYELTDLAPGLYYFRVQQVDFDGVYSYSNTVAALLDPNATTARIMGPFPNPAQNRVAFDVFLPRQGIISWRVEDVSGKQVSAGRWLQTAEGLQRYHLPIRNLPAGLYIVHVGAQGKQFSKKLIIQR